MEKILVLKINGMHCASCAMNIDGELEDLDVKESKTSYAKAETTVVFDENTVSVENIIRAIQSLGYMAETI